MRNYNSDHDATDSRHSAASEKDLPLLGSGGSEGSRPGRNFGLHHNENDTFDENDGLPSVNRRKGNSRFVSGLGFAVIGLLAIALLYAQMGGDDGAPVKKPVEDRLANNLPPLSLPEPPPPQPPIMGKVVPPIEQPIPVQKADGTVTSQDWMDRKMSGALLVKSDNNQSNSGAFGQVANTKAAVAGESASLLGNSLKPTVTRPASAEVLPNRDFMITKGTTLDCALETAIDSTVPGITTCRLTRDVYSDNGHVVLLDRGSQLVGEYQGGLRNGQARIFVLWTRAKTPNGVVISLDSPGTDALGRSGHAGWVDTHFMERFGAAILMSLVKDAMAYARSTQTRTDGTVIGGGSPDTDRLSVEILKNTVAIPPTLYVNQGDHIQIMVARDLNFSSVYELDLQQ